MFLAAFLANIYCTLIHREILVRFGVKVDGAIASFWQEPTPLLTRMGLECLAETDGLQLKNINQLNSEFLCNS